MGQRLRPPNFACVFAHLLPLMISVSSSLVVALCPDDVQIVERVYREGRSEAHFQYEIERDTKACDTVQLQYPQLYAASCEDADVDVTISSIPVLPNGTNVLPHVNLNVSALVHIPVFARFLPFAMLRGTKS
ncbi:hypothetical protein Tcan_00185 [Toxocara canis]|uniref:Uncharacterized protein n=1 Tax=Toxocara canis TaxID=6265 RepID=A0A0B2VCI4_TOXCA|nr:hypothetical protein Tcan_00185 [Toxocara canis]